MMLRPKHLLALCLLLAALPATATTFKLATIAPDGTNWMQAIRGGAEEISQRTEGRVKFRFYPGGIMGNDKSVLRKIRVGQLHGGAITGGGLSEIYPDAQIYSLPFAFRSYEEVDYVRGKMDPQIIAGLKERGFISFGLGEGGFAYLMSQQPIRTLEAFRKQKVWVPEGDRVSRTALEAVGVSPISLPLSDVLTGLQTGLIDTVGTSTSGAIALQWYTRVRYVTETPLLYLYGTLIIQRKAFERLSPADQAVVSEVMQRVFRELDVQNRKDNTEARQALVNQGIQFVSPEDKGNGWTEVVDRTMDSLHGSDIFSPAILKTLRQHLYDYRHGSTR